MGKRKSSARIALTVLGTVVLMIVFLRSPSAAVENTGGEKRKSRVLLLRKPNASEPPAITGVALTNAIREIDEGFAHLAKGEAVFNVPRVMTVDDTYRVVARIARSGEGQNILQNLPPGIATRWREAHITPTMKAQVTGADFVIKAAGTEEQLVGGGEYTEWAWLVTPEKTGEKDLTLTLTAVLHISGFEKPRDVVVTTQHVHVTISAKNVALRFLASYWDKAIAAVAGALALALWQWLWPKLKRHSGRAGF